MGASFSRRHPWLSRIAGVMFFLAVAVFVWVRVRMQGPYRDYRVDTDFLSGPAASATEPLEVGVSVREITPRMADYDPWQDVNGNGRFDPEKGDTWQDRNANGTFDFVWLAGFNMNRPAQGVNDPLWVRTLAFRHRDLVVAVVSVDCVGLTHERIIEARLRLAAEAPLVRHVIISSTHTHNAPDTMGIWSYRPLPSKFDQAYIDFVMRQVRESVVEASRQLRPVEMVLGTMDLPPAGYVRDSRPPLVYDRTLCAAQFRLVGTDTTVATLVSWGNHPEAMGGDNPLVSSDFPHYLREAMEKGLAGPQGMEGFGAPCVFWQGPVGGLMTPLGLDVPDRDGVTVHRTNGVGKTRALGENLARQSAALLRGTNAWVSTDHRLAVAAKSVFAPIAGTYKIPLMLGLIHPGWYDGKARTEVGALRLGDLEMLTIPGEIYPEIVDGGVETPEGRDFGGPALEVPPLRPQMQGRVRVVLNLANDEIGYLVPHTQWDEEPPYTYQLKHAPYGEGNSGGPDVATVIHHESLELLRRLQARWEAP